MENIITLSVGTTGTDDWAQTYQDISELARNLGSDMRYTSVSSFTQNDDETDEDVYTESGIRYDEQTLFKVHKAIGDAIRENDEDNPDLVNDIITNLQNAGILFRERA